ncbi:SDR family NAD(P)-dependent oxidoreductase [Hyphomonas johnsonii]|uniref:Omega-3 polyunsaturated fatty acid synthase PfaA n=1 Tax=Hyphomonas johnsonii MHS-2 TaxID=1280950 RepID=A0A059FUU8_9PROT|nr:SDR family NAD(P)-dependent oxidoreductase [Hyphomonas johnsonii]KCZ94291.1 omega-3 polyunsaturated fatty acid synthase PfaA [Hyphomonas johnsonii MHS-2]
MAQPVVAYGSDVRPVRFGAPVALPSWTGNIGLGQVEITDAEPQAAHAVASALGANGVIAKQVAAPSGVASTVILTEGLAAAAPADAHWSALAQARHAGTPGSRIIFLQPSHAVSGLPGLSRTLQKEWPETSVATWTLSATDAQARAAHILSALAASLGDALITLDGQAHLTQVGPSLTPPAAARAPAAPGLWLVTGGARGVTATCAVELARRTGGTFLLAGRSALSPWPQGIPPTTELKTLRAALAQQAVASGQKVKPADIDRAARAALAGQEIQATLTALASAGGTAHYVQLDLSDTAALAPAIAAIQARHGAITGLVHGAGVLADRLAMEKTEAEVRKVFGPKVDGLLALLGTLDTGHLTHVGLFSSASALFGNTGQADYAMANECLNQLARQLAANLPATQVKSFNWGPWDGGMVDAGLAAHFAQQGIALIGQADGARIFADQLLDSPHDVVEILVGDEWSGG